MNFKATVPAGLLILGLAEIACATPSIDFVDRDGDLATFSNTYCLVSHGGGASGFVHAKREDATPGRNGASVLELKNLLVGQEGEYTIKCSALAPDGERYEAQIEAVKFRKGASGSEAKTYDSSGFAYGVRIPISQTLTPCYEKEGAARGECIAQYYGTRRYVLNLSEALSDVQFKHRGYHSNIGIFLEANPRHRGG